MSRPLLARKDTKADEAAQRRAVAKRDGSMCRFLNKVGSRWVACGRYGTDTAHIYRRRECGKAVFDPAVAIRACRVCHDKYDRGEPGVRVHHLVEERAWRAITAVSKVLPPRQNLEGRRL